MSGVSIEYKGSTIATIQDSGSKVLKTQGKYCEGDILVDYVKEGITPTVQTYTQANEKTALYIADVTYNPSDYSDSSIGMYAVTTAYRKDRPAGIDINIPESGFLTIQDGVRAFTVAVTPGIFTVYNLVPGHTCTYVVRNGSDVIVAAGILKPTGTIRMINGGGDTFNIRDLGGWPCDGGSLRYGMVFRGCELNDNNSGTSMILTPEQISVFVDFLNIRDEIDLRGSVAAELNGLDDIAGTADDIVGSALGNGVGYGLFRINGYGANNAVQKERYAGAINRIIDDVTKSHPCYVHCVEGADRTGTICMLIEGICGVSQSDMDKDYELTSMCGRLRTRNNNQWPGFMNQIAAMPGVSFRDKSVAYVLQLGVTIESINALREALINGTPSPVTSPYAAVSLIANLTNVISSNSTAPRLYEPFSTTLSPAAGYESITNVSVSMAGNDITASCYNDGLIDIPRVIGDISIVAEGVAPVPSYTNLIPTSTIAGGGAVYNSVGYKNGAYVSGVNDGSDANYAATGYISYPVPASGLPPTIYVKGTSWLSESHTRLSLYNSSYEFLSVVSSTGTSGLHGMFDLEELGTNYFKLTPVASGNTSNIHEAANDVGYLRCSFKGDGSAFIIAFEPIA